MRQENVHPTQLFLAYELAVTRGDKRAAEKAARALRAAGYFVRRLPKSGCR